MYVLHQQLREKRELHYELRHLVGVCLGLAIFGGAMFYTGLLVGERYGAAGTFHDPELVYKSVFGESQGEEDDLAEQGGADLDLGEKGAAPELLHLEELGSLIPASAPRLKKTEEDTFAEETGTVMDLEVDLGSGSGNDAAALAQKVLAEQSRLANQAEEAERLAKEKEEKERLAKEESERLAAKKAEEERQAKIIAEKKRIAEAKAEEGRLARVRAEEKRLADEKAEKDRLARVQFEQDRLAKLKADKERQAKLKAEQERLAKIKAEQVKIARARAAAERAAKVRAEAARVAAAEKKRKELAAKDSAKKKKLPAVIRSQGPLPLIHTLESTSAAPAPKQVKSDGPSSTEKVARSAQVKMSVSKRASRKFTLQLFSFQDKSLASTMVRTLKPYQGQNPYVTEVRKNDSVWYRVHMGTFNTLADARTFQKSIESSRGLANTFLVSK